MARLWSFSSPAKKPVNPETIQVEPSVMATSTGVTRAPSVIRGTTRGTSVMATGTGAPVASTPGITMAKIEKDIKLILIKLGHLQYPRLR